MTASNRRTYTAITEAVPGCYYRVRCNVEGCDFEVTKASPRNVELAKVGHQHLKHWGHAWNFTVLPMKRDGQQLGAVADSIPLPREEAGQ